MAHPYYSNWNYGYTLAPSSDQSRGAYETYSTNPTNVAAATTHQQSHNSSAAEKSNKMFVSSSTNLSTSDQQQTPLIGPVKPELQQPSPDNDPTTAISRVHELAVANRLVERYEQIVKDPANPPSKGPFEFKLFIGAETYEGRGENIRVARQNAALLCLTNTKYQTAKERKLSMFRTANRVGITATSELHELAAKKNIIVEFKFLEPFNFEFKPSMRMWSKSEMLGNYRVQLNVGGYEFYGQAELPQQAKHNASTQALEILRKMKAKTAGEGKVIAKPGMSTDESASGEVEGGGGEGAEEAPKPVFNQPPKNVVMLLNEVAMMNNLTPNWDLKSETGPPHAKIFTWELIMGEFTTIGSGPNKKAAKQGAAEQMWATLPSDWKKNAKRRVSRMGTGWHNPRFAGKRGAHHMVGPMYGEPKDKKKSCNDLSTITANNPISSLYEFAKKKRIADPLFTTISEVVIGSTVANHGRGNQFKKVEYTLECEIDGKRYRATALNKKAAKTTAAMEAWDVIKQENNL